MPFQNQIAESAPFVAISRLRMLTDGEGITSLVAFFGCPLRCKYCLNPQSWREGAPIKKYGPKELFDELKIDNLYFLATGGGVTFGGGEPLLYPDFIANFAALCPNWKINIETCLNVPRSSVEAVAPLVNLFIIDVKDMNPQIYKAYTGGCNEAVKENLRFLVSAVGKEKILVRVPQIKGYNRRPDITASIKELKAIGIDRFDVFAYRSTASPKPSA